MVPMVTPILPDRNLAQDQWRRRRRLHELQGISQRRVGLVDLVDEQNVRHARRFELPQHQLQRRNLLLVGFADHDRHVGDGKHRLHLESKLDEARTVEEGIAIAQKFGVGSVEIDPHAMGTRFLGTVTDTAARCHVTGLWNCPRPLEDCLEKRRLAAAVRPHDGNATGAGCSAAGGCSGMS